MESEATRKARIATLQKEIDFIHCANELYWRQANPSDAAKAGYYRRHFFRACMRSANAKL